MPRELVPDVKVGGRDYGVFFIVNSTEKISECLKRDFILKQFYGLNLNSN